MLFMFRHEIHAAGMERMTPADAFHTQRNSLQATVSFYGPHAVSRTARVKTTVLPKKRGQAYLVCADEQYENSSNRLKSHSVPLFFRSQLYRLDRRFRQPRPAKQANKLPFHLLALGIQYPAPGNDNEVALGVETGMIQTKRLPQEALGPIPVDRPAKGALTGDHANPKTVAFPIASPYHHELPDDIGTLVEDLFEITG